MKGARPRKLWGGRFQKPTLKVVEQFTHSLAVDQRLALYDLKGSLIHARMLGRQRIIPSKDSNRLVAGLKQLLKSCEKGRLSLDSGAEDVHTALQNLLEKRIGPTAQHLHTARSRNDQVVTSLRLYCKEKVRQLNQRILHLQRTLLETAQKRQGLLMPGYTHLRQAQPVAVSHILLSYLPPLQRDRQRILSALQRIDELPLGSGALTGTGLPIDRRWVAKELGFPRISENSVDAITSRDFVAEFLSALSLLGVHGSRMAEDWILWSSQEFGFLSFSEELLTGSSMMPQKQNPDFLELTRAGAAKIIGNLSALLTLLKGLPSGYQRDLQNDKELLFEAIDRSELMLEVLTHGVLGLRWNRERLKRALENDALYATDLAEHLVTHGVPFAKAHRIVGQLLSYAERHQTSLRKLPLSLWRRFSPLFDHEVYRLLDPAVSVARKRSLGSTHPGQVAQSIRRWKKRLRQTHASI